MKKITLACRGDNKELEAEVKRLREQYLFLERALKELGKTTKRVQTLLSKLSSKE